MLLTDSYFSNSFLEIKAAAEHARQRCSTDEVLESVEILSIFLKDRGTPGGDPSRSHLESDATKSVKPKGKSILSHKTWIDGKPADSSRDQLERLTVVAGEVKPYVLDISWEDGEGKTRYQQIPVGH